MNMFVLGMAGVYVLVSPIIASAEPRGDILDRVGSCRCNSTKAIMDVRQELGCAAPSTYQISTEH